MRRLLPALLVAAALTLSSGCATPTTPRRPATAEQSATRRSPEPEQPYRVRLQELEERVRQLRERVFRTKRRMCGRSVGAGSG